MRKPRRRWGACTSADASPFSGAVSAHLAGHRLKSLDGLLPFFALRQGEGGAAGKKLKPGDREQRRRRGGGGGPPPRPPPPARRPGAAW